MRSDCRAVLSVWKFKSSSIIATKCHNRSSIAQRILIEFQTIIIQVKNLNKIFPVAPADYWKDIRDPKKFRIKLDDSERHGPNGVLIPAGTYKFEIPIKMPQARTLVTTTTTTTTPPTKE